MGERKLRLRVAPTQDAIASPPRTFLGNRDPEQQNPFRNASLTVSPGTRNIHLKVMISVWMTPNHCNIKKSCFTISTQIKTTWLALGAPRMIYSTVLNMGAISKVKGGSTTNINERNTLEKLTKIQPSSHESMDFLGSGNRW